MKIKSTIFPSHVSRVFVFRPTESCTLNNSMPKISQTKFCYLRLRQYINLHTGVITILTSKNAKRVTIKYGSESVYDDLNGL